MTLDIRRSAPKRYLAVCLYCGRGMWRSDHYNGRGQGHVDRDDDLRSGYHEPIADEATVREVDEAEFKQVAGILAGL